MTLINKILIQLPMRRQSLLTHTDLTALWSPDVCVNYAHIMAPNRE